MVVSSTSQGVKIASIDSTASRVLVLPRALMITGMSLALASVLEPLHTHERKYSRGNELPTRQTVPGPGGPRAPNHQHSAGGPRRVTLLSVLVFASLVELAAESAALLVLQCIAAEQCVLVQVLVRSSRLHWQAPYY